MGNAIFDNIVDFSSIESIWTEEYEDSMSALCELNSEARIDVIKANESNISERNMHLFPKLQSHIEFDYQTAAAREMKMTIPLLDPTVPTSSAPFKQHVYLGEVRNNNRENQEAYKSIDQLRLFMAQFIASADVFRNKLTQDRDRSVNNLSAFMDKQTELTSEQINRQNSQATKDAANLKKRLMKVIVDDMLSVIVEIKTEPSKEVIRDLTDKFRQINSAFNYKDCLGAEELELCMSLEKLVSELVSLLLEPDIRQQLASEDSQAIIELVIKLGFYIRKASVQFKSISLLIKNNLHQLMESRINEALMASGSMPLRLEGNRKEVELSNKSLLGGKHRFVCAGPVSFAIAVDEKVHLFNRTPDFKKHQLIRTLDNPSKKHPFLFDHQIWLYTEDKHIVSTDNSALRIKINPPCFKPLEKTIQDAQKLEDPTMFFLDSQDDLLWTAFYLPGKIVGATETLLKLIRVVGAFRVDYELKVANIEPATLTVVHFEDAPFTSPRPNFLECLTVFPGLNCVLEVASKKKLNCFDLRSGQLISKEVDLDFEMDGFDCYNLTVFEFDPESVTLYKRPAECSSFFVPIEPKAAGDINQKLENPIKYIKHLSIVHDDESEEEILEQPAVPDKGETVKPPQELRDSNAESAASWFTLLFKNAFASKNALTYGFHNREEKLKEHVKEYSSQGGLLEFNSAAVENLLALFEASILLPWTCVLPLLKIVEIYLGQASLFQDVKPSNTKVITQEAIFRFRTALFTLASRKKTLPDHAKPAFEMTWFRVFRHIAVLSKSMQKLNFNQLVSFIFTPSTIHRLDDLQRVFEELIGKTGMTLANPKELVDALLEVMIKNIGLIIEAELKTLISFGTEAFPDCFSDLAKFSKLKTNTKRMIIILIRLKDSFSQDQIEQLRKFGSQVSDSMIQKIAEFAAAQGSSLKNADKLQAFDRFFIQLLTTEIFYRELALSIYTSTKNKIEERLVALSRSLINACKPIVFTSIIQSTSATPEQVIEITVPKEPQHATKIIKTYLISLSNFKQVKIEPSDFDPLLDSIAITSIHKCDSANIGNGSLDKEFVAVPHSHSCGNKPIILDMNHFYLTVRSQYKLSECDRKIKVSIFGTAPIDHKMSKFEALHEICFQIAIDSFRQEIETTKNTSSDNSLSISSLEALNVVLGSRIFSHGFSVDVHNGFVESLKNNPAAESEMQEKSDPKQMLVQSRFEHLCTCLNLTSNQITHLNNLCQTLQKASMKKSLHTNLLGSIGFILVKSAFLACIYHDDSLEYATNEDTSSEKTQQFEAMWLLCTKVRVLCRSFEVEEQFTEFYQKIVILLSLSPAKSLKSSTSVQDDSDMPSKDVLEVVRLVKTFFDELKLRKFSKSKEVINTIPELIIKFISFETASGQILTLLSDRKRQYEAFSRIITIIENLMQGQKQDMRDTILLLNQVFRKENGALSHLSVDTNGLSKVQIAKLQGSIKCIFKSIVEYLCNKKHNGSKADDKTICMAIDTLKWLWRPSEFACVLVIDPETIVLSNPDLLQHQDVAFSLVELSGVIVEFCATNWRDLNTTIDGGSMSESAETVLSRNISFLFDTLDNNLDKYVQKPTLNAQLDWDQWFRDTRHLQRKILLETARASIQETMRKLTLTCEPDICSTELNNVDCKEDSRPKSAIEAALQITSQPHQQNNARPEPSNPAAAEDDYFGALFEDGDAQPAPEQPVVAQATQPAEPPAENAVQPAADANPQLLSVSSAASYDQSLQVAMESSKLALTYLYHSLQSCSQLSGYLTKYVKKLVETIQTALPAELKIFYINLLNLIYRSSEEKIELDACLLPRLYRSIRHHYERLFDQAIESYLVRDELHMPVVLFFRALLLHDRYTEDCMKFLYDSDWTDAFTLFALEVLDLTCRQIAPGSLVYHIEDRLKEQYIVIGDSAGVMTKAYLRDELTYRNNLRFEKGFRSKLRETKSLSLGLACVCMRTKNYRIFTYEEIELVHPTYDLEKFRSVIEPLPICAMVNQIGNDTGGILCFYRLSNIIRLSLHSKHKADFDRLCDKIKLNSHLQTVDWLRPLRPSDFEASLLRFKIHSEEKLSPIAANKPDLTPQNRYQELRTRLYSSLKSTYTGKSESANIYTQSIQLIGINYAHYLYAIRTSADLLQILLTVYQKQDPDSVLIVDTVLDECSQEQIQKFSQDFLSKLTNLESCLAELKLLAKLLTRFKDKLFGERLFSKLFDIAATIVLSKSHVCLVDNKQHLDTLAYSVELFAALSVHFKDQQFTENQFIAFERLLAFVRPHRVDSYEYSIQIRMENLENILHLFLRCVIQSYKFEARTVSNKPAFDYFRSLIRSLDLISQPDYHEDVAIKSLLMHELLEKKNTHPDWLVDLDKSIEKKLDFIQQYDHWMIFTLTKDAVVFTLDHRSNGDRKVVFKYDRNNGETFFYDLNILTHFDTVKDRDFHLSLMNERDYYLSPSIRFLSAYIDPNLDLPDDLLTMGLTDSAVIKGKFYSSYSSYYNIGYIEDGITLANKLFRCAGYYVERNKQLVLMNGYEIDDSRVNPHFVLKGHSSSSFPHVVIDLSALPVIKKFHLVFELLGALLEDENGNYLVLNAADNHTKESYDSSNMSRSVYQGFYYLYYQKHSLLENFTLKYFQKNPSFRIVSAYYCSNSLQLGIELNEGGSLLFNWNQGDRKATYVHYPGEEILKIVSISDKIAVLMKSGKLATHSEPEEFTGECGTHITCTKYLYEKVVDLICIDRQSLTVIMQNEKGEMVFKTAFNDSISDHEHAQSLLLPNSSFLENPTSRNIWLHPSARTQNMAAFNKGLEGTNIAEYPFVCSLNKQKDDLSFNSYSKRAEILKSDEFAIVCTRQLHYNESHQNSSLIAKIKAYFEAAEETCTEPTEIHKSSVLAYNCTTKERVFLAAYPEESEVSKFDLIVISKNRFKKAITTFADEFFINFSAVDPDITRKFYFYPDIFKLSDEQWSKMKEQTRSIWEPLLERFKANYLKYRDLFMDIAKINLNCDLSGRSPPHMWLRIQERVSENTEFYNFKEGNPTWFVVEDFTLVSYAVKLHNLMYYPFFRTLATYNHRSIDQATLARTHHNVLPSYFMAKLNYGGNDRQMYCRTDKFKGLNETTLKKQNWSLLNQLIFGFDSEQSKPGLNCRGFFERHRVELLGEGKPG